MDTCEKQAKIIRVTRVCQQELRSLLNPFFENFTTLVSLG